MRGQPNVLLPRSVAGLNREHGSLRADAESQQCISEVRSSPYCYLGKRHQASARLRPLRRAWAYCCRTMARAHAVTIACDKQPENSAGDLCLCRAPRCMQRPPSALRSPRRPPQAQGTTTPTMPEHGPQRERVASFTIVGRRETAGQRTDPPRKG